MIRSLVFAAATWLPCWVFATETPNVIYSVADELGFYELSCLGNPNIRTPRIDAMAREGVRMFGFPRHDNS